MIKLSSFAGGGGYFVLEALQSDRMTAGQTGALLSVPEVSGKVYKITTLATSTSNPQSGMSLIVDGVTVFNEKSLVDQSPANGMLASGAEFGVSSLYATNGPVVATRFIREIYCTSFSLIKNAGNTAQTIDYVYEIGSYK